MFSRTARSAALALTACVSAIGIPIAAAQCTDFDTYLSQRTSLLPDPIAQRAFAQLWLPRLKALIGQPGCPAGLASPAWHAMTLANQLADWTQSQTLARTGLAAATTDTDRAMWRMNLWDIAWHLRDPSQPQSIRSVIEEIDRFIAIAPAMQSADASGDPNNKVWALPMLEAMARKAQCWRELGDPIAAAAEEQQAVTLCATQRLRPIDTPGGFLPEEALFRASRDYITAGRGSLANDCILAIARLPQAERPAAQHVLNAIATIKDSALLPDFLRAYRNSHPADAWLVLIMADASFHMNPEALAPTIREEVSGWINAALALPPITFTQADELDRKMGLADPLSAPMPPESSLMNLQKQKVAYDIALGRFDQARITLEALTQQPDDTGWCAVMLQSLNARTKLP